MPHKYTKRLPRRWKLLFAGMRQAVSESPTDLLAASRALPSPGELPSPWETWFLFSLLEYRDRQLDARKLLRERLPEAVPPSDRLCMQDQPIETFLPNSPEWELKLECTEPPFAVLHHRVTGEYVRADVSALGGTRPIVFVESYLRDEAKPSETSATARIRQLCPWFNRDVLFREMHAERSLVRGGLLDEVHFDPEDAGRNVEPYAHRLSRLAVQRAALVRDFLYIWGRVADRLWLAAIIGDWLLAEELAQEEGNQELIAVTAERAKECRKQRLDMIRRWIGSGPACTMDFHALDALGADDLDVYVRRGLTSDSWGQGAVAMFLEECRNTPNWCGPVFDWLGKRRSETDRSGYETSFVTYLVRHGYRSAEALRLLAEDYGETGEAALIALEHAPELALPHVRAALRWDDDRSDDRPEMAVLGCSPLNKVAIALALIDTPWAHRQLREALSEMESAAWPNRCRALPLILALYESSAPSSPEDTATWKHLYDSEELQECRKYFRDSMDTDKHRLPWLSSVPL